MERKRINIKEFRELGFLQEVNRQFLHPLGLALEVTVDDDGKETLSGVWDDREDFEGIYFDFKNLDENELKLFKEKKERVNKEREKHTEHRIKLLGSVVEEL